MVADLRWLLSRLDFTAAFDILLVAVIIHIIFTIVRGTLADQLVRGIVVLLVFAFIIGNTLQLLVFDWLLRSVLSALVIAIPIIFQPELRRFLEQVGRQGTHPLARYIPIGESVSQALDIVAQTVGQLANRHWGGLIVIERETGLEDFVETGHRIDGQVSEDLLLAIFYPNSVLHDKAVIIRGDRVVAAACMLPLSENVPPGEGLGTRHAAAIGVSEVTDAIAICVSEESGIISVARGGSLLRHLDEDKLRTYLHSLFREEPGSGVLPWLPLPSLSRSRRERKVLK